MNEKSLLDLIKNKSKLCIRKEKGQIKIAGKTSLKFNDNFTKLSQKIDLSVNKMLSKIEKIKWKQLNIFHPLNFIKTNLVSFYH